MYVIIVYDVAETRVAKVCKYLRRFLHWVQNSAFEGELTEAQLAKITGELKKLIDKEHDSICIYRVQRKELVSRDILGHAKAKPGQVVE